MKVGDRVRRINYDHPSKAALLGDEGVIRHGDGTTLTFVQWDNRPFNPEYPHDPKNLKLIESAPVAAEKPTNPKDLIGSNKLPMSLFSRAAIAYGCLGFLEGTLKYGLVNWRVAGIRMSIYLDAAERHHAKLREGEWIDPETHVPHLGSLLACYGIIIDAHCAGKLLDDRPLSMPLSKVIAELEPVVSHLKEMFKDKTPVHYTIDKKDTQCQDH